MSSSSDSSPSNELKFGILYNSCYGGFNLSKEFFRRYKELNLENKKNNDNKKDDQNEIKNETENNKDHDNDDYQNSYYYSNYQSRTDPLAIQIWTELGSETASGHCSNIKCGWLPIKYKNHFKIDEYDGSESVYPDKQGYVKSLISKTECENMTREQLLEFIKEIKENL